MITARYVRRLLLAALIIAVAAALASCGSDDSSDSGGSGSGTSAPATTTSATDSGVAEAKARLEKAMAPPDFVPGTKLDGAKVAKLKGGTIWFVSQSQAVPYFVSVYDGIKEAAAALGMKTRVFDAQGKAAAWNQGVAAAIAQGAKGIVLGFPPDQMQAALGERAKKAGIPITDAGVVDLKDPAYPGSVGHVGWSYEDAGKIEADFMVADSGAKAKALALLSVGYKVQEYRLDGFRSELKELCSACSVAAVKHVPFAEWASQLPTITTSYLSRDPDINYILVAADGLALNVVKGVHQLHNTKVKLIGSDASEYNLGLIKAGDVQAADIGVSEKWLGWASLDVILRAITTGSADNEAVPLRMFTKDNLPDDIKDEDALFPSDWRGGFKQQWGL